MPPIVWRPHSASAPSAAGSDPGVSDVHRGEDTRVIRWWRANRMGSEMNDKDQERLLVQNLREAHQRARSWRGVSVYLLFLVGLFLLGTERVATMFDWLVWASIKAFPWLVAVVVVFCWWMAKAGPVPASSALSQAEQPATRSGKLEAQGCAPASGGQPMNPGAVQAPRRRR